MKVVISDDFSLKKIADSGQCFRVKEFPSGTFRFIYHEYVLYIQEVSAGFYEVSCDKDEWENVWFPYFDLEKNYAAVRQEIPSSDLYLTAAAATAKGIRILRQDPWEMLITFIISQRKSIPAIKGNVEQVCRLFGKKAQIGGEDIFFFPSAEQIYLQNRQNPKLLSDCRLGYRLPYVVDAVEKVYRGDIDLNAAAVLSDEELLYTLKSVKGVGEKVSNCISLFGYHRTSNAPVDVWIKRTIDQHYGGINPFPDFGENAGIMQQFMFYYALETKQKQIHG